MRITPITDVKFIRIWSRSEQFDEDVVHIIRSDKLEEEVLRVTCNYCYRSIIGDIYVIGLFESYHVQECPKLIA